VEFLVQVNGWHVDTGRADAFESFAAARDDVHLVRGFLKEQAYYELVADADVVLLPYQDSVYISGTSAVFEEAMYLGRPVVVPPRLLMASQLAPFPDAGRVAASLEADAFADAIAQVVTDYPRFAAGAARAGEAWRSKTGIDRFARTIVALATTRS
jgi:glycosyltransferase involved in cell wall biosynthesis